MMIFFSLLFPLLCTKILALILLVMTFDEGHPLSSYSVVYLSTAADINPL
jgi:hypothetical protein